MKLLRFGRYSRSFEHPTTLLLNPRRTSWLHSSPLTNFGCPSCGDNVDCRRRLRLNINIWFCCRCDSRGKLTRLWIGEDGGRVGGGWHCCVLVGVRRRRGVGCAAAVRRSVRWCWDIGGDRPCGRCYYRSCSHCSYLGMSVAVSWSGLVVGGVARSVGDTCGHRGLRIIGCCCNCWSSRCCCRQC